MDLLSHFGITVQLTHKTHSRIIILMEFVLQIKCQLIRFAPLYEGLKFFIIGVTGIRNLEIAFVGNIVVAFPTGQHKVITSIIDLQILLLVRPQSHR